MKTFPSFVLAVTACLTHALPSIYQRQAPDDTWDDEFIPQPLNFQFRDAGQCNFQLAYERFAYDNRYDVQYIAEYSDGSQTQLNPISGTLARDNVLLVEGLDDSRAYQVAFFPDGCRSGSQPTSFRANFLLRDGFTYENNWTTGSMPVLPNELPDTPQNVQIQAAKRSSTVTWDPVEGAESYIAVVQWFTGSEVGPLPFVWAREVSTTSFTYNREFTKASVLAVVKDTAFSPLNAVSDVTP